jgi:signal transduction histidine kinase
LFGRLLLLSGVATLVALIVAGLAIGQVLEREVMRGLDDRLDTQVAVLARAVRADGTLDRPRVVDLPGFGEAGSGWAWQVAGRRGRWSSGAGASIGENIVEGPADPHRRHGGPSRGDRHGTSDEPRPGERRGAGGEHLHIRTLAINTAEGAVTITAAGPRRIVERPLREAMVPLLGSLALLGAALAAAALVQLRLGLRPLTALRQSLAEVRAGRRRHVAGGQLREVQPLVDELNAMIDQNEAGLANARGHVANLAHGLKTPLAALAVELAEGGRDPDGRLRARVAEIDGRVRHHLGRARAAEPGARVATPLAGAVGDLVGVLARVHAERAVVAHAAIAADMAVAVDPRDLDELLGNLLDNAWRHARSVVVVTAARDGARVVVRIEDDGAGLADDAMAEAMLPGRRLDERGDGHGYGLPIARELAELNGGGLRLARSARGGLLVEVTLPAV